MLTANPDLRLIFVQSDQQAIGVARAVKAARRDGDVLVAESNASPKPDDKTGGLRGWIQGLVMGKAGAGVPSASARRMEAPEIPAPLSASLTFTASTPKLASML